MLRLSDVLGKISYPFGRICALGYTGGDHHGNRGWFTQFLALVLLYSEDPLLRAGMDYLSYLTAWA
ncbi:hypothetical protein LB504_000650 [Fusarium proliferatum]|nr:hypothetical protein LB504_000650 [Fusarium proliferatum]